MTAEKGMLVEHNTRRMFQALGRYTWKAGEGWIGDKISPPLPPPSLPSGGGIPRRLVAKSLVTTRTLRTQVQIKEVSRRWQVGECARRSEKAAKVILGRYLFFYPVEKAEE